VLTYSANTCKFSSSSMWERYALGSISGTLTPQQPVPEAAIPDQQRPVKPSLGRIPFPPAQGMGALLSDSSEHGQRAKRWRMGSWWGCRERHGTHPSVVLCCARRQGAGFQGELYPRVLVCRGRSFVMSCC